MVGKSGDERADRGVLRRNLLLGGLQFGGLSAVGVAVAAESTQPWTLAAGSGPDDWVNVKAFGAVGDDGNDDGPAIQQALDACPAGGVVYVPAGIYRTKRQLVLPPRVTVLGTNAAHWPQYSNDPSLSSCVKPFDGQFADTALIGMSGGGASFDHVSASRLVNLSLYGFTTVSNHQRQTNAAGAPIDGLHVVGQVVDLGLENVTINGFSGHGLHTDTAVMSGSAVHPKGWIMRNVAVQSCGGHAFLHDNTAGAGFATTDMTYLNCWAGTSTDGWHIASTISSDLIGCRAEFNRGNGYFVAGNSYLRFVGCDTDRNGLDGWHLECRGGGSRPVTLTGCVAARDGSGGGSAGIAILGGGETTPHNPVTISGCAVRVQRGDAAEPPYSPDHGLRVAFAPQVSVSGTLLGGTVAALSDGGGQVVYDDTTRFNKVDPANGETTLDFGRRWTVAAEATAEGADNSGSDLVVKRYDNEGKPLGSALRVRRKDGRVAIAATAPGANLHVETDGSVTGILAKATGEGTSSLAALSVETPASSDTKRAIDFRRTGDAVSRLRVDASVTGSGTITFGDGTKADANVYRGGENILATDDDFAIAAAGRTIRIKEGPNAKMGTLTLNGTSPVTVQTSAVKANSRIFLTIQAPGGTPGGVAYVAGRTPDVSFTVKGAANDTSTVAWLIVDPA